MKAPQGSKAPSFRVRDDDGDLLKDTYVHRHGPAEDPAAADDEEPNQGAADADSAETEDEAGGAGEIGAAQAVSKASRAVG